MHTNEWKDGEYLKEALMNGTACLTGALKEENKMISVLVNGFNVFVGRDHNQGRTIAAKAEADGFTTKTHIYYRNFVYLGYWHTWNRIITTNNQIIVVELTPINHHEWPKVALAKMMSWDGYPFNNDDKEVISLPKDIIASMEKNLGHEKTHELLTFPYEKHVSPDDITKAKTHSNGGWMPFQAVKDIRDGKINFWTNT